MLAKRRVGSYVVSQAGAIQVARRMKLIKAMEKYIEENKPDDELKTILSIHPNIAACCEPAFGIDVFLEMPDTELNELTEAVMELNPHWFAAPDQEKKTSEPQPTSIQNSAQS